jgi:predicted transcriptional regulator
MDRAKKARRNLLTELEQAVMSSIWRRGTATAQEVQTDLAPRHHLRESTVRTLLSRLEKKGHLTHEVQGRTYVYAGVESPRGFAVKIVQELIERFCAGSAEQLVACMVHHEVLDAGQLRRLADEVEQKSREGQSK